MNELKLTGTEWYKRLLIELGPAPDSTNMKNQRRKLLEAARKVAGIE